MALNEVASGGGTWKKMPKMRTLECAGGKKKERVNRKKTPRRRETSLTVLVSFIDALFLDATALISLK